MLPSPPIATSRTAVNLRRTLQMVETSGRTLLPPELAYSLGCSSEKVKRSPICERAAKVVPELVILAARTVRCTFLGVKTSLPVGNRVVGANGNCNRKWPSLCRTMISSDSSRQAVANSVAAICLIGCAAVIDVTLRG